MSYQTQEIAALLKEGLVLHESGKLNDAQLIYEAILKKQRDHFDALQFLAVIYRQQQKPEIALEYFEKAIQVNQTNPIVFNNRGVALKDLRRVDEALKSLDQAIQIKPDYTDAHFNRGNTLKELNRLEDALKSYDEVIRIKSEYIAAHINRGVVLQDLKRLDEALSSFDEAIRLQPDYAKASWNKALLLMLVGNYYEGWPLYESRLEIIETKNEHYTFPQLSWRGQEILTNQTLLIYCEQGLGDIIQFIRYLEYVYRLGIKIILEVPKPLVSLISSLHVPVIIVEKGQLLPHFDAYCPLLSLPYIFKTTVETIPFDVPYLFSDKKKVENWKTRLGKKNEKRIGLVWSGSVGHQNDQNRSIPLESFSELLKLPFEWHSLQKEYRKVDKNFLMTRTQIHPHHDELLDFSDTAALIECMDLVITVDTSVAHVAGAMGKPVWILLPYMPDFRWMLDREDCPWYPTAKLFRQDVSRDWASVLNLACKALE